MQAAITDPEAFQETIGMGQTDVIELADASQEPHVFLHPKRVILASATCELDSDMDVGGGTDDTAALQALLDLGGDEDSHLEIVLDGVALISDTLAMSSYTRLRILEDCGLFLAANSHCHMITGPNDGMATIVREVEILGPGAINGNDANQSKWLGGVSAELPSGPWDRVVGWVYGISFAGFNGLHIGGDLVLRNVKTFNIVLAHGERYRIEDVRVDYDIVNHEVFQNRDGVHQFSPLRKGLIRNFYSNGDDDVIAFNTDEDAALSGHPEDLVRGDAGDGGIVDVFVDGVFMDEAVNGIRFFGDSGTGWVDNIRIKDVTGSIYYGGMTCSPATQYTRAYAGLFSSGDSGLLRIGRVEIDNYSPTIADGADPSAYTDVVIHNVEQLILRNIPDGVKLNVTAANTERSPTGPGALGVLSCIGGRGFYPIYGGGGDLTLVGSGGSFAGAGVAPSPVWWRMFTGVTPGSSVVWRPCSNVYTRFGRGASDAGVDWNRPVTLVWGQLLDLPAGGTIRIQLGRSNAVATAAILSSAGIGIILTGGNVYIEAHDGADRVLSEALATYVTTQPTLMDFRARAWRGRLDLWCNGVHVGNILGSPVVASSDSAAGPHISVENGAAAVNCYIDHIPGAMAVFVES